MTERIDCAAIQVADDNIVSLPRPATHQIIMNELHRKGVNPRYWTNQGYITSTGRFVTSRDALRIAKFAGQVRRKGPEWDSLYTTDMDW